MFCTVEEDPAIGATTPKPPPQKTTNEDVRPLLPCDIFSNDQVDSINNDLIAQIHKEATLRQKTLTAANYLINFPYSIPYAYETSRIGYEYSAVYAGSGLFLKSITDNGKVYAPWGCYLDEPTPLYDNIKNLDGKFANGLHCSSFIRWCLYNAGIRGDIVKRETIANKFKEIPGVNTLTLETNTAKIREGDILHFTGHVAIVLEVRNDTVKFAESAIWNSDHKDKRNGLRWRTFNKSTTDYSTFRFKWLLDMSKIYGE